MVEVFSVLRGKQGLNRFRRLRIGVAVRLEFSDTMAYNLSRVVAVLAYVGIYVRYAVHIGATMIGLLNALSAHFESTCSR